MRITIIVVLVITLIAVVALLKFLSRRQAVTCKRCGCTRMTTFDRTPARRYSYPSGYPTDMLIECRLVGHLWSDNT